MLERSTTERKDESRARDSGGRKAPQRGNWKKWLKPVFVVAVLALAGFLLYRTLSRYSLEGIITSVTMIPAARFGLAALFAAMSYLCLTCFDYLALRYVGQPLPYRYVALASFCSLSLGHNIGFAALSSGAIRYRFYSRAGVNIEQIAKVILFCGITVGLGLSILGGCALLLRPNLAGEITGLSRAVVLTVGVACLAVPMAYVALAAVVRKTLKVRHWSLQMPEWRLALGQIIIGPVNFAFVAACLHQTLAGVGEVSYFAVAAVYVIAIVASLITHVPGGLGVIETVVLYLLPEGNLIGALLAFRVIYFLIPLAIGGSLFLITELVLRRRSSSQSAKS
ncbi:MAG TPA: UPF0104 family protein [Xanthobacteraceae bacterium]|nr:UPF0104 family protein [Xanthobacteraceae bacterium]